MASPLKKLERSLRYVGAGVAAWQLRRAKDDEVRLRAAGLLQERLGRMRGLPQKVGQLLSMTAGEDVAAELAKLREGAEAMPLAELTPLLEDAWGRPLGEVVKEIDEDGLAASLGQVHRAVLLDGREVAIKVRYPGVASAVDADLSALGWVASPVGNLRRGFRMDEYQHVLRESLVEELDYELEARNQMDVAEAAPGLALCVPEVVSELSHHDVLVTGWEAGETLEQVAGCWSVKDRERLGDLLVKQFLELALIHGLVHADPHPGNYRFRRTIQGRPEVVLYDFGCVHRLERDERLALARLLHSVASADRSEDPFPLLVALGFDADLLRPMRSRLPALCSVLFEPFASRARFDLESWNNGERLVDVLGDDRHAFRIAGPAKLLFLLRAWHGLLHQLDQLGVPALWSRPLTEVWRQLGEEARALDLPEPPDPSSTLGTLAEKLEIHVSRGGKTSARVGLPAGAVERLGDFLDDDLRERIAARGIVLDDLVADTRRRGYAPGVLFDLDDGERRFEVRLV